MSSELGNLSNLMKEIDEEAYKSWIKEVEEMHDKLIDEIEKIEEMYEKLGVES